VRTILSPSLHGKVHVPGKMPLAGDALFSGVIHPKKMSIAFTTGVVHDDGVGGPHPPTSFKKRRRRVVP
jgi:hypothetical protein